MKPLLIALTFAASLTAQTQAPIPYVSTYGAWTFCNNGMAASLHMDCSWYTPGTETYSLNIPDVTGSIAVGYRYTVNATLLDGSSKTLTGVVARNPGKDGYTIIQGLVFGGILKATVIEVEEMFPGIRTRVEGAPLTVSMARRR